MGQPAQKFLFYISFAKPEGWLGGLFVLAADEAQAYVTSFELGVNPGGEANVIQYKPGTPTPPKEYMNRLLSIEDLDRFSGGHVKAEPNTGTTIRMCCNEGRHHDA